MYVENRFQIRCQMKSVYGAPIIRIRRIKNAPAHTFSLRLFIEMQTMTCTATVVYMYIVIYSYKFSVYSLQLSQECNYQTQERGTFLEYVHSKNSSFVQNLFTLYNKLLMILIKE